MKVDEDAEIPIDKLRPKVLVRKDLGDLRVLAESIKREGIISPLLVSRAKDGVFEVICGRRRYEAAKLAGKERVPAKLIGPLDMPEALELIWKENELRKDFTLEEKALLMAAIVRFKGIRRAAESLNIPKSTVETLAIAGRVISAVSKVVQGSDIPRVKLKLAEAVGRALSKAGYRGGKFAEMAGKVYLALHDLPTGLALKVLSRWLEDPSLENLKKLVSEARSRRGIPVFKPPRIEERVPIEVNGGRNVEELLYECGYDHGAAYRLRREVSMKVVEFEGRYSGIHSLLCPRCNRPIRCRVCGSSLTCLCGFPHSSVRSRKYRYVKTDGRGERLGS